MSIQIRRWACGYTETVPKDGLKTLKGCLLAQALEDDPEAKEIVLENDVVQPCHLMSLGAMARGETVRIKDDLKGDLKGAAAAAKYFNWPLLEAVSDPTYAQMQVFAPYVDIYKPETYGPLLLWSITTGFTSLAQHILRVTEPGPLEGQALTLSVMKRDVNIVRRLLQRGVDPVTNYTPEYILDVWYPHKEFVYSMYDDDYWPPYITPYLEATTHQTFHIACLAGEASVLKCLLQDNRIRQMTPLKQIILDEIISNPVRAEIIASTDVGKEFSQNEALHLLLMFVTPYNNPDVYVVAHNLHLQIPEALRQQIVPQNNLEGEPMMALVKSFLA
jgi:hypothetical protein